MIVTVSNQKGGVGKSTIAVNLAACFARDGKDVLLVDADEQGSALDWKAERPSNLPPVQTVGLPVDNLHKEMQSLADRYDVIVIDGGGRITKTARAAVVVADVVLVPTLPSRPDIASTEDFFEKVIEVAQTFKDFRAAVLLNQVQGGTVLSRRSQEYMRASPYPTCTTELHQYVAYREAFALGLSVVEYDGASKAATEMQALYRELLEML
jgi:chromosome partitioning protein